MSQLVVRRVSPRLVKALKQRAAQAGRSAEAEHRLILQAALTIGGRHQDFKAFLLAIPSTGRWPLHRSKDRGRRVTL